MKPPVGERWGESRMSNFVSVIIGGFAAVCAWFGIEFLGKPFRTFFELKKEGLEVLARYSNVAARPGQVHPFPDNKIGLSMRLFTLGGFPQKKKAASRRRKAR